MPPVKSSASVGQDSSLSVLSVDLWYTPSYGCETLVTVCQSSTGDLCWLFPSWNNYVFFHEELQSKFCF